MSELTKTFVYSKLSKFLKTGYGLPKTVQVIPYAYIRSTKEILSILTLTNLSFLTDFGSTYTKDKGLISYICECIHENSLGVLDVGSEYVAENSSIAYAKVYDVVKGVEEIYAPLSPVIFVRYEFEVSEDLEELLREFKLKFSKKAEGIYRSSSVTNNITFLSPSDLFYTLRQTTATVTDPITGIVYSLDVEEKGFPADPRVSAIYAIDPSSGDIPFSQDVSQYANCCPEVTFYRDVSNVMKYSILTFFSIDLPILDGVEREAEIRDH